jgi:predicted small metal-binding protein
LKKAAGAGRAGVCFVCYGAGALSDTFNALPRSSVMDKIIECAKVDPSSGCTHVVRGKNEEEVLKNAMEHAKSHGLREMTPELMAKVKSAIRDAD